MRKVIITVATTGGVHRKDVNPKLNEIGFPEQPQEIAQAAYESFNEGAAIVHIHARDKEGIPSADPEIYKEIGELIRVKCNILINYTTAGGGNLNLEERIACLDANPDIASLNMGSMLRTIGPYAGTPFLNISSDIERYAKEMLNRDIKPEMEVYHHGMFREVDNLITKSLVKKPYYINLVLGMAYQGAVAGTVENFFSMRQLRPPDSIFNCCAVGPAQFLMSTLSMIAGGNARVGMEDNIYYSKGVLAKNNAQLVAKIVRIARELGLEIASPDEAREILEIKRKVKAYH
jgi:3-keto-5-aminohexanoate cleavage enzyme